MEKPTFEQGELVSTKSGTVIIVCNSTGANFFMGTVIKSKGSYNSGQHLEWRKDAVELYVGNLTMYGEPEPQALDNTNN